MSTSTVPEKPDPIRRVVTGHDDKGNAVFLYDNAAKRTQYEQKPGSLAYFSVSIHWRVTSIVSVQFQSDQCLIHNDLRSLGLLPVPYPIYKPMRIKLKQRLENWSSRMALCFDTWISRLWQFRPCTGLRVWTMVSVFAYTVSCCQSQMVSSDTWYLHTFPRNRHCHLWRFGNRTWQRGDQKDRSIRCCCATRNVSSISTLWRCNWCNTWHWFGYYPFFLAFTHGVTCQVPTMLVWYTSWLVQKK